MMTKEQDNDELCMNDGDSRIEYRSLNDIRLRKEALRKSIEADEKKIKTLWNGSFRWSASGMEALSKIQKKEIRFQISQSGNEGTL